MKIDAMDDTTQYLSVDEDGDADSGSQHKAKGSVGMLIVVIFAGILLAILMFCAITPKKKPSQ